MNFVLAVYKKKFETPLQALDRLRVEKPEFAKERLSYAGRLDPMAEGLMIVLVGEANKEREKYLSLDKTYITEILCGVSTDTHDLLGLVTEIKPMEIDEKIFAEIAISFVGKFNQKYPAYSSKTVGGIQLHELSRKGISVEIPEHDVSLYSAEILGHRKIGAKDILNNAVFSADSISGDFRQEKIKSEWEKEIVKFQDSQFDLFKLQLKTSSGFYVRQFAHDLGEKLDVPALAYSIKRTKVGRWEIE